MVVGKNVPMEVMLANLDMLYIREDEIKKKVADLYLEYEQLQEDKELLQTMIMYKKNAELRHKANGVRK